MGLITVTAMDTGAITDTTNGFDRMKRIRDKNNLASKDNIFKGIIRRSDVLAAFLHTYVDEFKDCSRETILSCIPTEINEGVAQERNVFPDSSKENELEMDTLFRVKIPESEDSVAVYVNIEGQNKYYLPYQIEKRIEAYAAELITSQKGKEYTNQNYDGIKKVYSIWLLFNPPEKSTNTIIRYDRKPEIICGNSDWDYPKFDLTHITMVYVGSYDDELPDAIGLPAALFGSGLDSQKRNNTLSDKYKITLTDEDSRRLNDMVSLMQSFYDGYENCKRISETEGRAKGMAEGRAEGRAEGNIETLSKCVASNVTRYGITVEEAMDDFDVADDIRDEVRRRAEAILNG